MALVGDGHSRSVGERLVMTKKRKRRPIVYTRKCRMKGCDNGIIDRNKSGICTNCWHKRPDEVFAKLNHERKLHDQVLAEIAQERKIKPDPRKPIFAMPEYGHGH